MLDRSKEAAVNHRLALFVSVLSLSMSAACAPRAELVEGEALTVLEGATLIDGTGAGPSDSTVVVVEGEMIKRIGKLGTLRYPADAQVLDLRGRWLVPGFVDMHSHIRPPI